MVQKIRPFSRHALLAGLHSQAFAEVPTRLTPETINQTIERFFAFLQLPAAVKTSLWYKHSAQRRGARAGYKYSEPTPNDPDGKETFHFHPSMLERWAEKRKRQPELDQLMEAGYEIYTEGCRIVRRVARAFEQDVPSLEQQFFPQGMHPFFHVRLLAYTYLPQNDGASIAVGHYDIGSLTVAFAESAPGLRIGGDLGTPLEPMTPVVHKPGTAIVMPGYSPPDELPHCGIMSAWHDVVQQPGQCLNERTVRWALVMFADRINAQTPHWNAAKIRRDTRSREPQQRFA